MTDLIERLEAATEGSRELDLICWDAPEGLQDIGCYEDPAAGCLDGDIYYAPHYTTSIDAALTLVPEGLSWRYDSALGYVELFDLGKSPILVSANLEDPTLGGHGPALAICIASLRAMEALTPERDREMQNIAALKAQEGGRDK